MTNKKLAAFSLVELLIIISILGIIWGSANLSSNLLKNSINQNSKIRQLKLALEEQITYANIFKQRIQINTEDLTLKILGNKFINEIQLVSPLKIESNENQLIFHPKQVCSPASINYINLTNECSLIISLRCRIRIQC